ncbi:MAG: 30S ribosomal protein S20 [Patescibacteria group bacterium]
MPIKESAKKALRQSEKRRLRNIHKNRKLKKNLKELGKFIDEKKIKEAKELLPKTYKLIDKAAKTGLMKENAASRKKSRLTKAINKV